MDQHRLAKLEQLFSIRHFVNAIDRRLPVPHEFARGQFVGEQHQLFDKLMRDVVLDLLEAQGFALRIQPHFDFGEFKIQRAGGEPLPAQERCQLPSDVKFTCQGVMRGTLEMGKSLFVSQTHHASNHRFCKAHVADPPVASDFGEDRKS